MSQTSFLGLLDARRTGAASMDGGKQSDLLSCVATLEASWGHLDDVLLARVAHRVQPAPRLTSEKKLQVEFTITPQDRFVVVNRVFIQHENGWLCLYDRNGRTGSSEQCGELYHYLNENELLPLIIELRTAEIR